MKGSRHHVMQAMCAICRHSQRQTIDRDLRAGRELRPLADEFGMRITALRYHRDEHVAALDRRGRRASALS